MCRFNLFLPVAFPDEYYHGLYFSFKPIKKNEFGTFLDNIYAYDVYTDNTFYSFGKGNYVHRDWEKIYSDLAQSYPEAYERLSRRPAVLGRQHLKPTPWLTERHGYDPT